MMFATDSAATAQTDTSLVAAPGTGKQIRVQQIYVTADTAMKVTFESGNSTQKWVQFVAANGGSVVPHAHTTGWFECDANEALTYTTDTAGNVFVHVGYTIV